MGTFPALTPTQPWKAHEGAPDRWTEAGGTLIPDFIRTSDHGVR
ncbi:hypothetical protein ABIA39_005903 [Nocardia sp. GAS34]